MKRLSKEQILMLHTQLIEETGGGDGVRDYNLLESRELTVPENISAAALRDMDEAISKFKMGEVSQPIDLSDF